MSKLFSSSHEKYDEEYDLRFNRLAFWYWLISEDLSGNQITVSKALSKAGISCESDEEKIYIEQKLGEITPALMNKSKKGGKRGVKSKAVIAIPIDGNTDKQRRRFDSLSDAASAAGVHNSTLCLDIKSNRPRNGYTWHYIYNKENDNCIHVCFNANSIEPNNTVSTLKEGI